MPAPLCRELDALEIHIRELVRVGIDMHLLHELLDHESVRLMDETGDEDRAALEARLAEIRRAIAVPPRV